MKQCILLFAFLALIGSLTYAQEYVPDENTVLLYHFNKTSGSDVSDASSNSNNGTASGTTIVDGMFGKARHFTDGSDYIEIPDSPSLDLSTADGLTLEAWIKLDSLPTAGYIFNKMGPGGSIDDEWAIAVTTDGMLNCSINGPSTDTQLPSRSKLNLSNWYHIAYVWNKNTSTSAIYINGALDTMTNSVVTSIQNTSIPVRIGQPTHPANSFFGIIDEVRISNKAREPWEFNVNQKLIAYYPFNGNANDESGNGHDGIVNGPTLVADRHGNSSSAYHIDGVDDYIDIGEFGEINNVSISVWFKSDTSYQVARLFGSSTNIAPYDNHIFSLTVEMNESNPRLVYLLSTRTGSPNELYGFVDGIPNDRDWHHIVFNRVANSVEVFIDDVKKNITVVHGDNTQSVNTHKAYFIGADNADDTWFRYPFKGSLDDMHIYNRTLSANEVNELYDNYRQRIVSINDIPNDQGGWVRITFDKIYLDSASMNPQITAYGVWRKKAEISKVKFAIPSACAINNDTLGMKYDFITPILAVQSPQYSTVVKTLADSPAVETYLITAHTSDPNVYYISDPASGYSVDNLSPAIVANVSAIKSESSVALSWATNPDPDIKEYQIHRSTRPDFSPNLQSRIGSTTTTNFTDNNPAFGYRNYYTVIAKDVHNNASNPSTITTADYPTTLSQSVREKWNMISVPLEVSDWSRVGLYPDATSPAYSYNSGYMASDSLINGAGYWLKFGEANNVPLTGYFLDVDTFDVNAGWNMIGSISFEVPINSITTIPPEMIVSNFFGYQPFGYNVASSIVPGSAYWVKASQSGKLVLSSPTIAKEKGTTVRIVATNELPPTPPDGSHITLNEIPKEYLMNQNWPNPFNPSTTIKYGLPEQAYVTLTVHNTLGQQVATLVNGQQKEGYHEVVFSNPNLPSGVYFYRLQAGTYTDTKKLLLIK